MRSSATRFEQQCKPFGEAEACGGPAGGLDLDEGLGHAGGRVCVEGPKVR